MADACFVSLHFNWSLTFTGSHFWLHRQLGITVTGNDNVPPAVCLPPLECAHTRYLSCLATAPEVGGVRPGLQIKKLKPSKEKGWFQSQVLGLRGPRCLSTEGLPPARRFENPWRQQPWPSEANILRFHLLQSLSKTVLILNRPAAATQREKRHRCEEDVGVFQGRPRPGTPGAGMATRCSPRPARPGPATATATARRREGRRAGGGEREGKGRGDQW